jgi:copper transport protein
MRRAEARIYAAALLALVASGVAPIASAHALPVSSTPSPGSDLATAPTEVVMIFNEAPDAALSSIIVRDSSGAIVSIGRAVPVRGGPNALRVPLLPLKAAIYTVVWRVVSAVDAHLASGSFSFGVRTAPPQNSEASTGRSVDDALSVPVGAVAGRWLLYAGLFVLLGAAFVGNLIYATPPGATLSLAAVAWVVGAIGLMLVVWVQASDAGIGAIALLGTSVGRSALIRGIPLLIAGIAIAAQMRRWRPTVRGLGVVGVATAGALLADAATSHAAAGVAAHAGGHPAHLDVLVQWLHVSAAGAWLGGLVVLLACLRGRPGGDETARIARRFAMSAVIGIVVVTATGVFRALTEIGSMANLVSTDFGRLLVAKSFLLIVLAGLGAINHFRSVPAAGRMLEPLRRVGGTELGVGAIVLLLSASLVNLAPPPPAPRNDTTPSSAEAARAGP